MKPVDPTYPSAASLKLVESAYPSSLRGVEPLYPTNIKGVELVHHASSLKSLEAGTYSTSAKTLEPLVYPTTTSSSSSSYPSTTSYHPSFPDSTPDSYFQPCQIFQVGHHRNLKKMVFQTIFIFLLWKANISIIG